MKQPIIIFQGDSVTDSGRVRDEAGKDLGKGYVALLAAQVGADYPQRNFRILNRGVGGDKIVQLYARWRDDVINIRPDILSILIGVNDSYGEYTSWHNGVAHEKFGRIYRELLDEALACNARCRLVLCEPFSMDASMKFLPVKLNTSRKAKADLRGKQKIVQSLAERYGAVFIPLQRIFDDLQKTAPDPAYWVLDGLHPSLSGHAVIARRWLAGARSLLG